MLTAEEMKEQHIQAVDAARNTFLEVLGEDRQKKMTVGKHEAHNHVHLRGVLEEADTTCPRAADTIRWMLWRNILEAQRMARMAGALDV